MIKILYLIRVFKSLSFMVNMIGQVIKDLYSFFIMFSLFIFAVAQSFMVMETDVAAYGRVPEIFAQIINTIRVAYGDFSVIDPLQTFDYKYSADELEEGQSEYK